MSRLYYDLHLHSCLSPCGDEDMTPCNLVNMAKLNGLDVIALTDHNSCKNCAAAMAAGGEAGITVIPGMELCTSEEIHVVCLFPSLEQAMAFDALVEKRIVPVENKPDIFGEQFLYDENDHIIGREDNLLIMATTIGVYEVIPLVEACGGFCYPAHVDKAANSITACLGDLPEDIGFSAAELSPRADWKAMKEQYPILSKMFLLSSSDAHYLEHIAEPRLTLEAEENTPEGILSSLRKAVRANNC